MNARRRKSKESPAEILFKAPWWVSIAIGVGVFVFLKWIAPAAFGSNQILKPLTMLMSGLAWLFSGIFFLLGAAAFAREKMAGGRATSSGKSSATWNPRVIDGGKGSSAEGFPDVDQPVPSQWSPAPTVNTPPTEWTIDLLRDLEWKRFEDVCQKFYETKGVTCSPA